jgi:hypothetical protein
MQTRLGGSSALWVKTRQVSCKRQNLHAAGCLAGKQRGLGRVTIAAESSSRVTNTKEKIESADGQASYWAYPTLSARPAHGFGFGGERSSCSKCTGREPPARHSPPESKFMIDPCQVKSARFIRQTLLPTFHKLASNISCICLSYIVSAIQAPANHVPAYEIGTRALLA